MDYRGMGERVREKRLGLRLTQEMLAERIDVSLSFIGHIERGEKVPSLETMTKLANELDTTMDYLVRGVKTRCDRRGCPMYDEINRVLEILNCKNQDGQ